MSKINSRHGCFPGHAAHRPADSGNPLYEAILGLVNAGLALLLDWDETSCLLVLRSGETFRLDSDGLTRLG
jgi:hypothetical protein